MTHGLPKDDKWGQLPRNLAFSKHEGIYVPPYLQRERDMLLSILPHRSGEVADTMTDEIYGPIPFSRLGSALVHHPIYHLTAEKRQLSFIYEKYQGGTHTRRSHLMGSYWVILQYLESLISRHQMGGVSPETLLAVVYAVLLHDIGHYPHSHVFDRLEGVLPNHEWLSAQLILKSEIAEILEAYGVNPLRVAELIDPPEGGLTHAEDELLHMLVSGPLDADKADYIPRDARHLNVSLGVNYRNVADSLVVVPWNGAKRLAIHSRWVAEVMAFLYARVELYQIGILEPTARVMSEMLVASIWKGIEVGALSRNPLEYWELGDSTLLDKLRGLHKGKDMPSETMEIAETLYRGQSYPIVLEVSPAATALFDKVNRLRGKFEMKKEVERKLASALSMSEGRDIPPHWILLSLPNPPKGLIRDLLVYSPNPPAGRKSIESFAEASGMTEAVLTQRQVLNQNILFAAHPAVSGLLREDNVLPALLRAVEETN